MPIVYSSLTNDVSYGGWLKGGADLPRRGPNVIIKGGAGRGAKGLVTPYGVATHVSDEEMEMLEKDDAFIRHQKRGFLTVIKSNTEKDANKIGKDLNQDDGSRPLNENTMPSNAAKTSDEKPAKKKKEAAV